ncbi:MAG: NAD(P)-dependent oxidoreductase [Candidatus Aminicenantes bacterium]
MKEKFTIVFCYNPAYVPPQVIEVAKRDLPEGFELIPVERDAPNEKKLAIYKRADFLMEFSADPSTEEFEALCNVKMIQLLSAGYNNFDMETANKKKIPVANNHGNCVAVAEFTVLLSLALLRKLVVHHNTTKAGKWLEHNLMVEMGELACKTFGIIGMGFVGKELAKRIKSFESTVLYHDIRRLNPDQEKSLGIEYTPLDELLKESDIISLNLALTPQSRKLISRKELEMMKSTAYLINVSRAGVVDQDELYWALYHRKIAGAAIDVYLKEPPNPNNPLFLLDNVIFTPHMAGASLDTWARRIQIAYENFKRIVNGQPPHFVVNPDF